LLFFYEKFTIFNKSLLSLRGAKRRSNPQTLSPDGVSFISFLVLKARIKRRSSRGLIAPAFQPLLAFAFCSAEKRKEHPEGDLGNKSMIKIYESTLGTLEVKNLWKNYAN
jgi:hypothetical protein